MKRFTTLNLLAFAVAITALWGCGGNKPPTTAPGADRIRQNVDALIALRSQEPTLPGVAFSDSLTRVILADRSPADSALLTGRIYYDLVHRLGEAPTEQSAEAAARRLLSTPPRGTRITRAYADRLLAETKTRASADPRFQSDVQESFAGLVTWSSSGGCKDDQGYNVPVLECMFPTVVMLAADWWI
jgi:hypothetical protein